MSYSKERDNYIVLAAPILQRLESAGFEAWLVGGCVREALRAEQRQAGPQEAEAGAPQAAAEASPVIGINLTANAPATDIDITTNALPEEVCRIFSDMTVIETGLKHGTVTVLLEPPEPDKLSAPDGAPEPDQLPAPSAPPGGLHESQPARRIPIEITTYRVDGTYSDGRHPDQVRFVRSLEEDLARRDFTVNAIAMDLRGEVADPFGGQEDLEAGIIRAVGEPQRRFEEDGLRILRALRFAAVLTMDAAGAAPNLAVRRPDAATMPDSAALVSPASGGRPRGFRIEPATEEALFACKELLRGISAERVFTELRKLVCGEAAGDIVRRYVDILGVIIPELLPMKGFDQRNPYHKYDVLEHCVRAMEAIRPVPAYLKLAALLHDIGKPEVFTIDENGIGHFYRHPQVGAAIARRVLGRLKADGFTCRRIETLIHYHDLVFQEDDRLLRRWMKRYTPEVLLEILAIKRADNIATGNVTEDLLQKFDRIDLRVRQLLEQSEQGQTCFCMKDLAISGKDLIAAGIPEGPEIGRLLNELLDSVIDEALPNEREALLDAAMRRGRTT